MFRVLLVAGLAHAWVGVPRCPARLTESSRLFSSAEEGDKSWLSMSVEERKAWKAEREGPRTAPGRYSAQALIAQRFPNGIPEYTGPKPEDDEDCLIYGLDGSSNVDPACLTNEDDGVDDWLSSIASIADDDDITDLPDPADL